MKAIEPAVSAFFSSYRAAFERLDARVIADHFAYPGHMTSDTGELVLLPIPTREEWIAKIDQLLNMYRRLGVSAARINDLRVFSLSPRLFHAVVEWALYDGRGGKLYDFEATYTLVDVGNGLRITAVSHNEMLRHREALGRFQQQGHTQS